MIKITAGISNYFFSGNIYLSPSQSIDLDASNLTKTQLLDIIEAEFLGNLVVSDIVEIQKQYKKVTGGSIEGSEEFLQRINSLETKYDNLIIGEVSSEVYWSSSEW